MNYNSIIWFSLLSKEQIASNNMQISTGGNSVHQRGKAEGGKKCKCCFTQPRWASLSQACKESQHILAIFPHSLLRRPKEHV